MGKTLTKIALISDIHFGDDAYIKEYAAPDTKLNGKMSTRPNHTSTAIEIMKAQGVQYLFIAGDLTSKGSPVEYHYVKNKIDEIASGAGIDKSNVIWCCGNHDNDWCISDLDRDYKKYCEGIQSAAKKGYESISSAVLDLYLHQELMDPCDVPSTGVYMDERIIVFVLNSSVECVRKKAVEHGKITEGQMDWFRREASKYKDDKRWKIVLLHHHPFSYPYPIQVDDLSQLSDGSELCEVIGKNGINLVLHGHRHHPVCKTTLENGWENAVTFICSGSFAVKPTERMDGEIPNTFHILELSDNVGELVMLSYEYGSSCGWKEIAGERTDVIAVDRIMHLGKNITKADIKSDLKKLIGQVDNYKIIESEHYPESVKYSSIATVRGVIKECEAEEHCRIKMDGAEMTIKKKK